MELLGYLRRSLLGALLLLVLGIPATGWPCVSEASGDYSDPDTWTDASCGVGGVPNEGTGAITLSTGHTITLDQPDLVADSITWEQNGALLCTSGASLHVLDWTDAEASSNDDFFVDEYTQTNAACTSNGAPLACCTGEGTGACETGADHVTAAASWSAGIALGSAGQTVHFRKGTHYEAASFDGEGKNIGSYGLGTIGYGPRPLWKLDAAETITQTGAADTTVTHTEISCGEVLRATLIMDRTTCVAPCAIEFKLDVDHTHLNSTEPRLWRSDYADSYTEVRGGEDWLFPLTKWNFGDPGSGHWERGARANTTTPALKNEEFPLPLAFHVYEHPGQYVATSETCYSGQCVLNATTLTITSAEDQYDDAATFCFANTADTFQGCPHDTDNDGTCEQELSNCIVIADSDTDGVKTAIEDNCVTADNRRCLFRRGDTFLENTNQVDIDNDHVLVGAFGNPQTARPIFDATSLSGPTFLEIGGQTDVTVMDIDIQMASNDTQKAIAAATGGGGVDCAGPEWENVLLLNLYIDVPDTGINFRPNDVNNHNGCNHSNVVIQELVTEGGGVLGDNDGNDLLMSGDSGAILGSRWGDRDGDEHGVRCKTCTDFLFAHNEMGRILSTDNDGCGNPRFLLSVRNGFATGQWDEGDREDDMAEEYSQRFGVVDNYVGVCGINNLQTIVERTSHVNTSPSSAHEFWHTYTFWGNQYSALQRTDSSSIKFQQLSGIYGLIANNAFFGDTDNTTGNTGIDFTAIEDGKVDTHANLETNIQFMHVYNNAYFANSGETATFLPISVGSASQGEPETIFIANNVFVDLNSSDAFIDNNGTGQIIECNGSTTTCNQWETTNQFQSGITSLTGANDDQPNLDLFKTIAGFRTSNDFGVVPDSEAADADAYENCRADSTPILGIFEDGGTPCVHLDDTDTNTLNATSSVGVNLSRNEDFVPGHPFANAAKSFTPWKEDNTPASCDFNDDGDYTGDVDEAGYPLDGIGSSQCIWFEIWPDDFPAYKWEGGTWDLLFDGTATAVFGGAASGSDCTDGNCTFTVSELTSETLGIQIGFTSLTSLSNLRIYPPGGVCAASSTAPYGGFQPWGYCDDTGSESLITEDTCSGDYPSCVSIKDAAENGGLLFHPLWVKRLQPYRTLRLMDWLHTNSHADVTGDDTFQAIRNEEDWVKWGSYTYHYDNRTLGPRSLTTPGNVPVEVAILACKTLGAECWVNVPHLASDAEIERMGRMCRDLTDLNCYFELSNETWNGSFQQMDDIINAANAAYGDCSLGPAPCQGNGNCVNCRDTWVGKRTEEMCNALEAVFDETGEDSRLICVMGAQANTEQTLDDRLDCDCNDAGGDGCGSGDPTCTFTHLDAVSPALYFSTNADCAIPDQTATNLCDDSDGGDTDSMADHIAARITGASDWVTANYDELADRSPTLDHVYMVIYEGGTNYTDKSSNSGVCLEVQTNSCIRTQYMSALDGYEAHFTDDSEDVRVWMAFNYLTAFDDDGGDVTVGHLSTYGGRGGLDGTQAAWPKEDGILDWSTDNPCWWTDCNLREVSGGGGGGGGEGVRGGSITGGSISEAEPLPLEWPWPDPEPLTCAVR